MTNVRKWSTTNYEQIVEYPNGRLPENGTASAIPLAAFLARVSRHYALARLCVHVRYYLTADPDEGVSRAYQLAPPKKFVGLAATICTTMRDLRPVTCAVLLLTVKYHPLAKSADASVSVYPGDG
jgi:hypothetical protein